MAAPHTVTYIGAGAKSLIARIRNKGVYFIVCLHNTRSIEFQYSHYAEPRNPSGPAICSRRASAASTCVV